MPATPPSCSDLSQVQLLGPSWRHFDRIEPIITTGCRHRRKWWKWQLIENLKLASLLPAVSDSISIIRWLLSTWTTRAASADCMQQFAVFFLCSACSFCVQFARNYYYHCIIAHRSFIVIVRLSCCRPHYVSCASVLSSVPYTSSLLENKTAQKNPK